MSIALDKTLILTIAAPIASALAFLAYKHPSDYRKLFKVVAVTILLVLGVMALWLYAMDYAIHIVRASLAEPAADSITKQLHDSKPPMIMFHGGFVCFLYLLFLEMMDYWLVSKPRTSA